MHVVGVPYDGLVIIFALEVVLLAALFIRDGGKVEAVLAFRLEVPDSSTATVETTSAD